ncbi:hypothetical protein FNF31_05997 [Cafeteria roenbergensis]|uniref:WW domain-containing protein n=1 Tax=Cafeteria roenbergensis TaxID=33653 RepID=A0A5A8CW57_CAFRO|nr:hypothetical protein FNF31_05997 [Cafeteria roenbergensis]
MIELHTSPSQDGAAQQQWEVFYDPSTGFPYYHNKATGDTQWENPWADAGGVGSASMAMELRASWRVYERFSFVGMFDALTAVRHRRQLPRAQPRADAIAAIAAMAGMEFDVAQARLEVALLKAEAMAGVQVAPARRASVGAGDPDREGSASWQSGQPQAQGEGEWGDAGGESLGFDGFGGAGEGEGEAEDEDLLAMAGEDEPAEAALAGLHASSAAASGAAARAHGAVSLPPPGTLPGTRVALSGGWNDLGNMWYSRGEWEMAMECFRRSLFWNPEQTATLVNTASLLVKLGFERDAAVVWDYFVDVDGGTMGGWTPEREEQLVASIEEGIRLAARLPGARGRTLGELRLTGEMPDVAAIQAAAREAVTEAASLARAAQADLSADDPAEGGGRAALAAADDAATDGPVAQSTEAAQAETEVGRPTGKSAFAQPKPQMAQAVSWRTWALGWAAGVCAAAGLLLWLGSVVADVVWPVPLGTRRLRRKKRVR